MVRLRGVARAQPVKCRLVGEVLDGQTEGGRRWFGWGGVDGVATTADATAADREGGKNAGVLRQRGVN